MMLKVKMRKEVMMRTTRKTAVRMMNRRPVVKLMRHSELRCKLLLVQLWLAWTKRLVLRGTFSSKAHFDLRLWSIVAIFAIEIPGMNCL